MKEVYFFWKMLLETESTCERGLGLICLAWGDSLLHLRTAEGQAVCSPGCASWHGCSAGDCPCSPMSRVRGPVPRLRAYI